MKAMKPFYFTHPQYGKLRVVVIGGKIYYCLMDVKNIFKKSVQKLYETIADSEGELKNLNIMMMKDMKIKYNLFFENQEMGKEETEAENVNADINFCDEQLVKDLVDRHVAAEKLAAKWVIGFVKSRLNDAENASLFEANGVDEISDNSLILPINVSYGSFPQALLLSTLQREDSISLIITSKVLASVFNLFICIFRFLIPVKIVFLLFIIEI